MQAGLEPDIISYNAVMDAWTQAGLHMAADGWLAQAGARDTSAESAATGGRAGGRVLTRRRLCVQSPPDRKAYRGCPRPSRWGDLVGDRALGGAAPSQARARLGFEGSTGDSPRNGTQMASEVESSISLYELWPDQPGRQYLEKT